jgi:hypothetical protein
VPDIAALPAYLVYYNLSSCSESRESANSASWVYLPVHPCLRTTLLFFQTLDRKRLSLSYIFPSLPSIFTSLQPIIHIFHRSPTSIMGIFTRFLKRFWLGLLRALRAGFARSPLMWTIGFLLGMWGPKVPSTAAWAGVVVGVALILLIVCCLEARLVDTAFPYLIDCATSADGSKNSNGGQGAALDRG